jgi:flavin-dependent dehydrogenase
MPINKNIEIGIIGAGPAGTMTGLLLARAGYEVTIFEKTQSIVRRLCGEYLCPKGVELLKSYSLFNQTCFSFMPLNGMIISPSLGESITCDFPQTDRQWNGVSVDRKMFDQRLLDLAIESGVKVIYNTSIRKITNDNGLWILENQLEDEFYCHLLVAADGRTSTVAKLLNHSAKLNTSRIAIHCYLPRLKHFGLRHGEMHIFKDGSYCGINPISDKEVNLSFVVDSSKVRSNNLHELCNNYLKQSNRLCETFGQIPDNTILSTITPLKNVNTHVAGNGLAYVGDASGFIDPLTGEGIYNALLSATVLVDAIQSESTIETALQTYKKNKNKIQLQKKILNTVFQTVIKSPFLCSIIARVIRTKQTRADAFIGIIGNIYTPIRGLLEILK